MSLAEFGSAMIFVLLVYGGWNEMGLRQRGGEGAAKEHPSRSIDRHTAVTAIYVVVKSGLRNRAGLQGARQATLPPTCWNAASDGGPAAP